MVETPLLKIDREEKFARVAINRADVRNAFNADLIRELREAFVELGRDPAIRVIVFSGAGDVFCAGADAGWMQNSLTLTPEQNREDAQRMADMYRAIDECPKFVIGQIHGAAMGGGAGLVACCDYAIADKRTKFAFSETKLGIIPAVISSFVLPKIGVSAARHWFLTGAVFDSEQAVAMGLVHELVTHDDPENMETAVRRARERAFAAGPEALAEAKKLISTVRVLERDASIRHCVETIARIRTSPEGQEGLRAFLEKRKPTWLSSEKS